MGIHSGQHGHLRRSQLWRPQGHQWPQRPQRPANASKCKRALKRPRCEAPQDKREKEIAKEKEIKKVSPCFAYTDSQRSSKSYIVLLL